MIDLCISCPHIYEGKREDLVYGCISCEYNKNQLKQWHDDTHVHNLWIKVCSRPKLK
jgi:predicted  nucleic acid-binding Zn-ribbon protein